MKQGSGSWQLYYICRDYLGSITHLANSSGSLTQELSYGACSVKLAFHERSKMKSLVELIPISEAVREGRLRDPGNYTAYAPGSEPSLFLGRGYTGHEHLPWFGLVNMNGRLYDGAVGRLLSPDNYVQLPDFSQNLNRYSYCLNNPLTYTDPSGENFWSALASGFSFGLYGLWQHNNAIKQGYSSLDAYLHAGGSTAVTALTFYVGGTIAGSGISFANTLSIAGSSLTNSVGNYLVTGGKSDIAISFGIASYNFTQKDWGYLGKKGNRWYEDVGYGLGAIANFSDISKGFHNDAVQLQTENTPSMYESGKDKIGHSQLLDIDGNSLIDFGPGGDFFKFDKGVNNWIEYASEGRLTQTVDITGNIYSNPQMIRGVNLSAIQRYSSRLNNNPGFYNFALRSCSTQAARALTLGGVPVFGLHPYLLRFQISTGLRPYMFNSTYIKGY